LSLLLTHAYFLADDPAEQKIMKPYPPLGLLYISAYLKKQKLEHQVFDTTFSGFDALTELLHREKFRQVGIYTNLMTKLNVLKLIRYIRAQDDLKNMYIILGGPDVRYNAEQYCEAGADILVIGEGEQTMAELVNTLNTPMNPFLDQVDGIAFKNYFGKVVFNKERTKLKEVDELPFPNREAVPIEKYLAAWKKRHGQSALNISTQRGCPYTCQWCSTAVYGQSYRRRSPDRVCDEMEDVMKRYRPDTIWFVDDVFTVSHKWLKAFADEVQRRAIRMPYECITRADRLDAEAIADLKRSGCFRVWIGAESGSQKVIDRMDRRVDVGQVRDMLQAARKAGIETGTFIMLGYPGETERDIIDTVEHLVASNPHHFTITVAYPIRGTGLYEEVKSSLVNPPDWFTSTDRDMDFERTYPREYYNYAVRFVVNEVKYRTLPLWQRWLSPRAWIFRMKSIAAQEGMQRNKIRS
jgi:radical SAM superfamily enzyme YgiQ (UPF0313 family)